MSYILDALKKSEQERQKQGIPDINALHSDSPYGQVSKKNYWPFAIGGLLVVLIVVVLITQPLSISLNVNDSNSASSSVSNQETQPSNQPLHSADTQMQAVNPNQQTNVAVTTQNQQQQTINPNRIDPSSVEDNQQPAFGDERIDPGQGQINMQGAAAPNANDFAAENAPIQTLLEVPEFVRDSFPALSFETHIYSSEPADRRVMINGKMAVEGMRVSSGVMLEEITEDGVVVLFKGYRIAVVAF